MTEPRVSIVVPSRGRPGYLDVALGSIAPQLAELGGELVVVDDGRDPETAAVAARHGVRTIVTGSGQGANAARNAGVRETAGELVVFVDDDVRAPARWLAALVAGAGRYPEHELLGGPIHAAIDGGPRSCGRERAPITTLDLGPADRDAELVWSANMAARRAALRRVGPFDESIHGRGEEEEWERRLAAAGGRIRYLAAAGLEHRRTGADARLASLTRAQYALGRSARRNDERKGTAPGTASELGTLAATLAHVVRRGCPAMLAAAGHSAGRLREAVAGPR